MSRQPAPVRLRKHNFATLSSVNRVVTAAGGARLSVAATFDESRRAFQASIAAGNQLVSETSHLEVVCTGQRLAGNKNDEIRCATGCRNPANGRRLGIVRLRPLTLSPPLQ